MPDNDALASNGEPRQPGGWRSRLGIFGFGAAACAACCVGPILTTLGATTAGGIVSARFIGVVGLVVAYIVEFIVRDNDLVFGLCRGALIGIARAAVIVQNGLFDSRPRIVTWINAGFPLVGGILVGAIAASL